MEAKCRDEGKELDESGREDGGKYGERGPAEDKFLGKESKDACGGRGGGDHPAEDKASSGRRSHDVDVAKAGGEDGGRADDGQFPDGLDEAALDALLVREINAVIFHDKSFEHELREYIDDHCGEVDLDSAGGGEQRLEYTELHNEFSALFENRVEERLFVHQLSTGQVHGALRRMALAEDSSEEQAVMQTLFALVDYESFMILVRQTRRGEPWDMESMLRR